MLEKILTILRGYLDVFPIMMSIAILVVLTYFIAKWVGKLVQFSLPKTMNNSLKYFIVKVVRVLFFIISIIMILNSFGLNSTSITAMVGVSTLAIGTSLKDIFVNSVNGISMIIGGHIGIGDTVTICGSTGKITKIDLIYTKIDCNGEIKLIPNSKMLNEIITIKKS